MPESKLLEEEGKKYDAVIISHPMAYDRFNEAMIGDIHR